MDIGDILNSLEHDTTIQIAIESLNDIVDITTAVNRIE
jgi:hypothetical protein